MAKFFYQSLLIKRLLIGIASLLVVVVLVLVFFPWDMLREPLNRYVSAQLGRRFEITERLSVHLGRAITVRLDGLEIANPDWAREPILSRRKPLSSTSGFGLFWLARSICLVWS